MSNLSKRKIDGSGGGDSHGDAQTGASADGAGVSACADIGVCMDAGVGLGVDAGGARACCGAGDGVTGATLQSDRLNRWCFALVKHCYCIVQCWC